MRARRAGQAGGLLLSLLAAIVAAFLATLAVAPRLPTLTLRDPGVLASLHNDTARHILKGSKPAWTTVIARPRRASDNKAIKPLTVGFYVSDDQESRASLRAHIASLDVVAPQWTNVKDAAGDIAQTDDPQATALIAAAPHPPAIMDTVYNYLNGAFDAGVADGVILNRAAEDKLLASLLDLAAKHGYAGFCFDLENMSPKGLKAYPAFLKHAHDVLAPHGLEVWVTAPFDDEAYPFKAIQKAADTLILMAYDEHWSTGAPGPTAGQDWFETNLARRMGALDPDRTIIAFGSYGYDWMTKARNGEPAEVMNFHDAMTAARDSGAAITMDDNALNPTFSYADENGQPHQVWFQDAATLFNEMKVTDPWRVRGYAMWRLGDEDPDMWTLLDKPYGQVSAAGLPPLSIGDGVDFDGAGEVLNVKATPTPGKRALEFDPDTGLISDEHYLQLPTGYVIQRYDSHPGWVALTFDDGPDGHWTPKILDILKQKNAPATFFLIGENMQVHPELVEREYKMGMVMGNHTYTHPNIAELPITEMHIELNATQRLFEVITGRSMRLMRPPYFGDAEPSTPAEVDPLVAAQKLGYLIAGLRIDPDDWKKPPAQEIIDSTLAQLATPGTSDRPSGQVILLHDSGGDRSHTVQALPALIDQLRAHGYRLVTLAELAGMTPDQAMPPTQRQWAELTLDRAGFFIFREIDLGLETLFISAIALGLLRLLFMAVLSLIHRAREAKREPAMLDPETGPMVSVLIPCFNEEKVIASSVARILESRWSRLEVIVLDDGSTDGTAAEVETHFGGDPRVRLLRFPNGGKANALNKGLDQVRGEIIVALDADTLFPPDTIARLARWFVDPRVGAVAGNALVGNRRNLITRWQALEYVTAQNLERRALAALGAVTVVPGAVGAWRRGALEQLGGYPSDTLAEDQDLTIAVQRAGWRVEFDPEARAYTEAPETVAGLLKQRFRWSFGTLQCIWKHRAATFSLKNPILGFVALPQIWLFQIILASAAPLVDLAVIWSLVSAGLDRYFHPIEWSPDKLIQALLYWAVFILVDLSAAALGMALEKRAPWGDLPQIPVQRFGYRQLMYYVVVKAVITAVRGPRVAWGKLERRATAAVGGQP
jgi:cellulose synthase/poly-beta-1,6-N-acetylglucosamine synthase-like glycosyltransferase/spore germination protein YaaH/peptidoglycan/xylan/chitin deacetylase (PgdA/CDA1 family)